MHAPCLHITAQHSTAQRIRVLPTFSYRFSWATDLPSHSRASAMQNSLLAPLTRPCPAKRSYMYIRKYESGAAFFPLVWQMLLVCQVRG